MAKKKSTKSASAGKKKILAKPSAPKKASAKKSAKTPPSKCPTCGNTLGKSHQHLDSALQVLQGLGQNVMLNEVMVHAAVAQSSPAVAVVWALQRATDVPFGMGTSVSGLGINTLAKWEALTNDIRKKRSSYSLGGAATQSALPAPSGDTVNALIGVVTANS